MTAWLDTLTDEGFVFVVLLAGAVAGIAVASVYAWWAGRW